LLQLRSDLVAATHVRTQDRQNYRHLRMSIQIGIWGSWARS
jgi:hypothetical protein